MSMQMMERKKFVAYFDESFSSGERVMLVDEDFFSEDNGYRGPEIRMVRALGVDEVTWISGKRHRIWRIQ